MQEAACPSRKCASCIILYKTRGGEGSPKELFRIDERAGPPASRYLETVEGCDLSETDDESETEPNEEFRDGGANRSPSCSQIKSATSDEGHPEDDKSESDVSTSRPRSTFFYR